MDTMELKAIAVYDDHERGFYITNNVFFIGDLSLKLRRVPGQDFAHMNAPVSEIPTGIHPINVYGIPSTLYIWEIYKGDKVGLIVSNTDTDAVSFASLKYKKGPSHVEKRHNCSLEKVRG
jgi:hypothetical protein